MNKYKAGRSAMGRPAKWALVDVVGTKGTRPSYCNWTNLNLDIS